MLVFVSGETLDFWVGAEFVSTERVTGDFSISSKTGGAAATLSTFVVMVVPVADLSELVSMLSTEATIVPLPKEI